MERGKIIFLNGTTNSGKSAIAKALQDVLEEPYLYFSVDAFLHMLPIRFMSNDHEDIPEVDEHALARVFPKLLSGIHHSIDSFASQGVDLIVDHVLQRRDWLEECVEILKDYPVLFVGVRCNLDDIKHREQEKHTIDGLARLQFDIVHAHEIYDIEVDTCECSPMECAQKIKKGIETETGGRAFKEINQRIIENTLW